MGILGRESRGRLSTFEFFDRQSWAYLGTLLINGVSNTGGIASTQQPLPGYPLGIFAAINSDTSTVGVGWNMISTYIQPAVADPSLMFASIQDQMVLLKNGRGQLYWPALGINEIGSWDVVEGYQLYLRSAQTLTVTGAVADPALLSTDLTSGWNRVGYWRDAPMALQPAWAAISFWPRMAVAKFIGQILPSTKSALYSPGKGTRST